ncbi:hypothetical protein [Streptomyces achromogenes]
MSLLRTFGRYLFVPGPAAQSGGVSPCAALGLCSARNRRLAVAAGAALPAGSAALRFGVFHAGVASAEDPA